MKRICFCWDTEVSKVQQRSGIQVDTPESLKEIELPLLSPYNKAYEILPTEDPISFTLVGRQFMSNCLAVIEEDGVCIHKEYIPGSSYERSVHK